jgi:hypothetical protein
MWSLPPITQHLHDLIIKHWENFSTEGKSTRKQVRSKCCQEREQEQEKILTEKNNNG